MHGEYGPEHNAALFAVFLEGFNGTDDNPHQKHTEKDIVIAIPKPIGGQIMINDIYEHRHKEAAQIEPQQIDFSVFRIMVPPNHAEQKQRIRDPSDTCEYQGRSHGWSKEI